MNENNCYFIRKEVPGLLRDTKWENDSVRNPATPDLKEIGKDFFDNSKSETYHITIEDLPVTVTALIKRTSKKWKN